MKIEIWSDVMCPFCYIGKRKFEKALEQFHGKDHVSIVWKSFQLSPGIKTDPSKNIHQFLAEHKGISIEQAKEMNDQVAAMAAKEGLEYNFDRSVVANSFNAHRFAHYAKTKGKQQAAEEALFRSYFTDGKNIDDVSTLMELGESIGLEAEAIHEILATDMYSADVQADINEARELGVRGVPFFVFNRKFAVSGAQDSTVFLQALQNASQNP